MTIKLTDFSWPNRHTKQVILETFFPPNLLAYHSTEKNKNKNKMALIKTDRKHTKSKRRSKTRTRTAHKCVHIMRTTGVHNTAQNRSGCLLSYPPDNHRISDIISWRGIKLTHNYSSINGYFKILHQGKIQKVLSLHALHSFASSHCHTSADNKVLLLVSRLAENPR